MSPVPRRRSPTSKMPGLLATIVATVFTTSAVLMGTGLSSGSSSSSGPSAPPVRGSNAQQHLSLLQRGVEFGEMNARLLGPDSHGSGANNGCPADCGCPGTPTDCPRWYDVDQIERSASLEDPLSAKVMQIRQDARSKETFAMCEGSTGAALLATGGWCLKLKDGGHQFVAGRRNISVPWNHVLPSRRIADELGQMIRKEGIKSINDFGAGVGQYEAAILSKFPHLNYKAYDGAGNVENITDGYLKHFDLTLPLHLPKADWVMSLEVGEHVPSKYEGMLIRNLHRHNCKGVILSWGVLGQGGFHHVNDHSNAYVINVFGDLGYRHDSDLSDKFRNSSMNYGWFVNSVMVFRRLQDAC